MVEWFFNYSTRRQCIVFLSSLVVLFQGNLLEWGQLFFGKILWWGDYFQAGNFPRGKLSSGAIVQWAIVWGQFSSGTIVRRRGQLSGGQSPSGQLSRGQLSREKFTSGAIVLEPLKNTYLEEHLLAAASDFFLNCYKTRAR